MRYQSRIVGEFRAFAYQMKGTTSVLTTLFSKTLRQLRFRFSNQIHLKKYSDYDSYRRTQQEGNERKLHLIYARETNITHIANYAKQRIGQVTAVLCHGTRNGAELRWFRSALGEKLQVLGTEISRTAAQFPDTIQWDFHEEKPEWKGAWDVIYSNSWDHACDPEKAFRAWLNCLSPQGLLFLEHSKNHEPSATNELDPFGASLKGLIDFVNGLEPRHFRVVDVIDELPDAKNRHVVVVGSIAQGTSILGRN